MGFYTYMAVESFIGKSQHSLEVFVLVSRGDFCVALYEPIKSCIPISTVLIGGSNQRVNGML